MLNHMHVLIALLLSIAPPESLVTSIIAALIPPAATFLLVLITNKLIPAISKLPTLVMQVVVIAIGFGLSKVGGLIGVTLPDSLAGFDSNSVQALLNGLAALAVHKLYKDHAPTSLGGSGTS